MKTMISHPRTTLWGKLVAKFLDGIEKVMPYGYEDDSGFHFGAEPRRIRHLARVRSARSERRSERHHNRFQTNADSDPISRMMPIK